MSVVFLKNVFKAEIKIIVALNIFWRIIKLKQTATNFVNTTVRQIQGIYNGMRGRPTPLRVGN